MNNVRMNVRNFLLGATLEEIRNEIIISMEKKDTLRAEYCLEMLAEALPARTGGTLHEFVKKHDVTMIGGPTVLVFSRHADLENLSDFVVIAVLAKKSTILMPAPGVKITGCETCGWVGCQSGCSAYLG